MSFDALYFWFNLIEGLWWIVMSGGCVYAWFRFGATAYARLARVTGITLFIFGISDFVEIHTGGFFGHDQWLFVWKAACVVVLVYALARYMQLRRRNEPLTRAGNTSHTLV